MRGENKKQFMGELAVLRQRVTELEKSETELRRTEETLKHNENRYRTISELASDFVYSIRVEPDGTQVSERATETLNRIIGVTYAELLDYGS